MDFKVTITEDKEGAFAEWATFEQYADALAYIDRAMASWNNFSSDQTMVVKLEKVSSQTETLGVNVKEEQNLSDIFGRP